MRKIVWCCTAVVALAAVAACLTTQYASYHPDSLVGRCVITGLRLVAVYDPTVQVGQAAARSVQMAEKAVLAVPTTTGLVPGDSQEPAYETEEARACPPADPVPAPQEELAATGPAENEEAVPAAKIVIQPDADEPAQTPMTGAAEEAELPPSVMPHAEDEPAPEKMPYAEDEEESEEVDASPIDFWYGLLQQAMSHCTDAGSQEKCENGVTIEGTRESEHCPVCPYTGRCPHCEHGNPAAGTHHEQPAAEDGGEEEDTTPAVRPPQEGRGAGKTPSPPGSDTQEFRPSDANPEDFESIPY
jgi:hypothetical protein